MKELENGDLVLDNGVIIPAEKRTKCEVYSRVVGYLRPVSQFNKGKKAHHYLIAKDPGVPMRRSEPKPEIQVNIAQMARFAMPCPYDGMERCDSRNFSFVANEEKKKKEKQEDKQLAWAEIP